MKTYLKTFSHLSFYFICIFFLGCVICYSCKKTEFREEVVRLTKDMEMDEFSDSTFFSNVNSIMEYQGDIYVSLAKRMQIARLDRDLRLKNTIGIQGRGPGEFIYIDKFFVSDDIVWVGDVGAAAIMKFTTNGDFIEVEERTERRYNMLSRYWIEDGFMYFSKTDLDKKTSLAILELNKDGNGIYKQFGEFTDFGSLSKDIGQNQRYVFVSGDHIITVPYSIPVIERYDRNTLELIETYDLTTYPPIKDMYERTLQNPIFKDPNTSFGLIGDAFLKDKILYIAYIGIVKAEGNNEYIGIMEFDIDESIRYVKRYAFDYEVARLCVTDDYIYVAPMGGGVIDRYPLNQ